MNDQNEQIKKYMDMDLDDLFLELYRIEEKKNEEIHLLADGEKKIVTQKGAAIFQQYELKIYYLICLKGNICKYVKEGFTDYQALALQIADLISPAMLPFPPFLISSILIKKGVQVYCACNMQIGEERKKRLLAIAKSVIEQFVKGPKGENTSKGKIVTVQSAVSFIGMFGSTEDTIFLNDKREKLDLRIGNLVY